MWFLDGVVVSSTRFLGNTRLFRDLFRVISLYGTVTLATINYPCMLSTEILFPRCPEKSTVLIWLESVPTFRIVSHGAIPIATRISSVHHAVGLYGAAAARILNERRLHTLEFSDIETFRIIVFLSRKRKPHPFRVSFDLGITGPGGHDGFVVTLAIPTHDRSCVGIRYRSTEWIRWSGAYNIT
jgi:hypothetical protein